jgi:TonB-linked SusC/RagA family outer membrane protein
MKHFQLQSKGIWLIPLFLLFLQLRTTAQDTTGTVIKGKVTDRSNTGLPSVTVQVKGTGSRTTTNEEGLFSIKVQNRNGALVFTSIGFQQKEVPLNNQTEVSVQLEASQNTLEDVVVIGYGTQKKRNVTGAVVSFDASKLDERPVTRVDQALVGQMAGVAVKQTSGALGKGFSIQVRGVGSITAGNEPLYVVDGFPLTPAAPDRNGNFKGNPLDNMNPNDIEDIQVLKDASSAAIYGSRAANGVVLITTKRGKLGKAKIDLNSYVGYVERTRKLDMLNPEEWIDRATEIINAQWVASGTGRTASQTNEQRRVILGLNTGQVNTGFMTDDRWFQPGHPGLRLIDWQDEAFRKGLQQNHQISASGGTETVRYYVSGNYTKQEGMVIHTDYTAYNARANVEVNASKKLKFGINLAPSYSIINDPGVEGKDNIFHQMVSFTPVQEDTMGLYPNVGMNGQYRWSVSPNSPIGKLQYNIGQTKRFRVLSTIFGEYQIIPGLSFRTTINYDHNDNKIKGYTPYIIASNLDTRIAQQTLQTSGSDSTLRRQIFVNENTLSYSTTFRGGHDVSAVVGFAYNTDYIATSRLASVGGFNSNSITTLNAANGVTGNTTEERNVLLSYLGRVQYNYNGKYLLSASIRRDGSSRFGNNNKWGVFPSASIGWRISEERFLNTVPFINDLKLRASWGQAGNYNITNYGTLPLLGNYNYVFNNGQVIGQAPAGIPNPDLTWEKSNTFDGGFDITVWNNRISASFDVYRRTSEALLLNVPIPQATGFGSYLANAGSVRNKGWELEIISRNIIRKDFTWTTSANLSHNTNKVISLVEGQSQILIPSSFDINHSLLRVGEPLYSIYVVKQIGILTQEDINNKVALFGSETVGDPKYFDANGDGTIDANDRVIVGHPTPDYVWGITNTFKYKQFDLSVMVQGQWGGSIYSLLGRALGRTGQNFVDNALGTYRNRWRSPDDPGDGIVSKAYSTFGRIKNTDWLYPSDYFRVRNITLGYNLKSAIKTKSVQGARLFLTLENFWGHDKYKGGANPEATNTDLSGNSSLPEPGDYGGLPLPRSLIFGVNFTF